MGIASILMILVQGWFLDNWILMFSSNPELFTGFWMKFLMATISFLLVCAGAGLSTSMCLGIAGFEACLFTLADKIKIEYKYLKMTSEFFFFTLAMLLDGVYGIMTIVEVLLYGLGMSFFVIQYNRTFLKRLGMSDERNELGRNNRKYIREQLTKNP
jgi:hypothetical protein